ncbi:MAG: serine/threonine-protein kinase [Planctomycetia bacterium]|nr:serine/threonine-protein kinase [Planctomycetia bacterium]
MEQLEKGTKIALETCTSLTIDSYIAEGGQGQVYKVLYEDQPRALKWYKPAALKKRELFLKNLRENVRKGSPGPMFLWPLGVTEEVNGTFGYVMELRPKRFSGFTDFLNARVRFANELARIRSAIHIVTGFQQLQNKGFSYQDLNDGNFFIDPTNGDVLICDNDNVAPHGTHTGIAGKCRYMAPEVILGKEQPNMHTDRFSMSLILFLLFFMNHPLEGQRTLTPCLTPEKERDFYGENPVFIFDPNDDSNSPHPAIHRNAPQLWKEYPPYFQEVFRKEFSKDRMTGEGRKHRQDTWQWLKQLVRLRSDLCQCPCQKDEFYLFEPKSCGKCNRRFTTPFQIQTPEMTIPLHHGSEIYRCYLDGLYGDTETSLGTVEYSEAKKKWVFRNTSGEALECTLPTGESRILPPERTGTILPGLRLRFKGLTATFQPQN